MRRTRTGLLLAVACLLLTSGAWAQTAPTLTGATGLIDSPTAESLPIGRFSFGLNAAYSPMMAGPALSYPPYPEDPLRYSRGRFGVSMGFGLSNSWEASLAFGALEYKAGSRMWAGNINGRDRVGRFNVSETDKLRLGTKLILNPRDPVKVVATLGAAFATGGGVNEPDSFSTGRTDWDFGLSLNYDWFTLATSYLSAASYGTPGALYGTTNVGAAVPNEWSVRIGANIPFVPGFFRGIFEINRTFFYGGDSNPLPFSEAVLGGRVSLGKELGLTATGALRINIDQWARYGTSPTPIGGVVMVGWVPQPAAPRRPVVAAAPREEPPTAPVAAPPPPAAPAPAPALATAAPPAPKPSTTTTDEILFDSGKSRLTNIAKAILDGVALRLKNNLSATCAVAGTTDPKEKGDRPALAKARAEAAKDYLVKRHGIDAGRISVAATGDGDAADSTRNRRALVTVTFP